MRIAFVSRWLWDEARRYGVGNGPEYQRVLAYQQMGNEVIVFSQSPEAQWFEVGQIGELQTVLIPRWARKWWLAPVDKVLKWVASHRKVATDAWATGFFLDRFGPFDAVEAQCEEPDGLILAVLSLFRRLPPWCVQMFSLRYRFSCGKPVFIQKKLLRFVFRRAPRIRANAPMVKRWMIEEYGADEAKVEVLPPNIARSFLEGDLLPAPSSDCRHLLCVAALNEKKGVQIFLEAAGILSRRHSGWRFAVAGGEGEGDGFAERLKARAGELSLEECLEWKGSLPPDQLQEAMREAALIVIPSLFDEFNRVAVEAVVRGRPVVLSDGCGAADWIARERCGRVVPAGDPEALASGIERMFEDEGRKALVEKAAGHFRQEFSALEVGRRALGSFR